MSEKTEFGEVKTLEESKLAQAGIFTIKPGKAIKKHYWKEGTEIVYVIQGKTNTLKEKDLVIYKPGDIHHELKNESDEDVIILCVSIPPWKKENVVELE